MKFTPTHLVTIYRENSSATANDDGQIPETEQEYCKRWVELKPLSPFAGTENMQADQQQADVLWMVRLLSDTAVRAITPRMWLKLEDGTRLDVIASFDPTMRQEYHSLKCNRRM